MSSRIMNNGGFSLIELVVVLLVVGILAGVAMQSLQGSLEDARRSATEREMEMLADAVVGNPELADQTGRTDFGYVGDVGAFPANLSALRSNPGGYGTWQGPYVQAGYTEDSLGFLKDAWGSSYAYTSGVSIQSAGNGTPLVKKLADAPSDYLSNTLSGTIHDRDDSLPGTGKAPLINVQIRYPNGSGGWSSSVVNPDAAGAFSFYGLPVGRHQLTAVYTTANDTVMRDVTIMPRNLASVSLRFAGAYFTSTPMTLTLRPNGSGSVTELTKSAGCAANWNCVDESSSDEASTTVSTASSSFKEDLYAAENSGLSSGTIDSVVIFARVQATGSASARKAHTLIRVGGSDYAGNDIDIDAYSSFTNMSTRYTTNPNTGVAWTWAAIDALEIGVGLKKSSQCTQVWIVVYYTS